MKLEQLTFTRFLAAFAIVIFHFWQNVSPFNHDSIDYFFEHGYIWVSYFFVLSGFIMMIAYGEKDNINPKNYYINRLARIYPVYFLGILSLVLIKIGTDTGIYVKGVILNVITIQSWIPREALSFNFPGWSITVEFFFYLLFPLLFNRYYTKVSYKKLILPIIGIWVGSQLLTNWLDQNLVMEDMYVRRDIIKFFPLMHLNEFLIGNLTGLFFMQKLKHKRMNFDWLIILLVILLFTYLYYGPEINIHNGVMALLFVPLILALSMNKGWITKLFQSKALVLLGEISFGIYILQVPVYDLCLHFFEKKEIQEEQTQMIIYLLTLIVISFISYRYIETPLRMKIREWKTREKSVRHS